MHKTRVDVSVNASLQAPKFATGGWHLVAVVVVDPSPVWGLVVASGEGATSFWDTDIGGREGV